MTVRAIPANIHRPPRNDRSLSVAAATQQGVSNASRDVPVTLAKAPWEKDE
jgi:hypothetical protein